MKLLIGPGLPRSGTTYTYHNLMSKENSGFFNSPSTKETNFFSKNFQFDDFRKMCKTDLEDRYFIDYSPSYLLKNNSFVKNIKKIDKSIDVKFILHLRHPIDQMFSHYLHDLKAHISKREKGDSVEYSFFSEKALKKYSPMRSDKIKALIDRFGKENILVANFYKDLPDPENFTQRLNSFLNISLSTLSPNVFNLGGWMPYYVYGGENGREFVVEDKIKKVPKKSLLLVNGKQSRIWNDVDFDVAAQVIEGSSTWTRELSSAQVKLLYSTVEEDWRKVLNLLDEDPGDYPCAETLSAKPAPLTTEVSDLLSNSNVSLKNLIESSF